MILPFTPIEYQTINWCRDCQVADHYLCFDPTCHCEHPIHGDTLPLVGSGPMVGDAFYRATGGG